MGTELTMGFAVSGLDPSVLPFRSAEGISAASEIHRLASPFSPGLLAVAGPTWEGRVIHQNVRFTAGLGKPFAQFRPGALDGPVDGGGRTFLASPRSLSLWDLRMGLGVEYRVGPVTPFLDVVGTVQLASADLAIDGTPATYTSRGFVAAARAGLRLSVSRHVVVSVAGEYGIAGPTRFSVSLMAGWYLFER